jgi:hypothetical protein
MTQEKTTKPLRTYARSWWLLRVGLMTVVLVLASLLLSKHPVAAQSPASDQYEATELDSSAPATPPTAPRDPNAAADAPSTLPNWVPNIFGEDPGVDPPAPRDPEAAGSAPSILPGWFPSLPDVFGGDPGVDPPAPRDPEAGVEEPSILPNWVPNIFGEDPSVDPPAPNDPEASGTAPSTDLAAGEYAKGNIASRESAAKNEGSTTCTAGTAGADSGVSTEGCPSGDGNGNGSVGGNPSAGVGPEVTVPGDFPEDPEEGPIGPVIAAGNDTSDDPVDSSEPGIGGDAGLPTKPPPLTEKEKQECAKAPEKEKRNCKIVGALYCDSVSIVLRGYYPSSVCQTLMEERMCGTQNDAWVTQACENRKLKEKAWEQFERERTEQCRRFGTFGGSDFLCGPFHGGWLDPGTWFETNP